MKLSMAAITIVASAVMASGANVGFNACPNVNDDTAGCQLLITVTAVSSTGVALIYFVSQNSSPLSSGPYDGSDDTLVGIQNETTSVLLSIVLTGPSGDTIAAFDGDGACSGAYGTIPGCAGATDPSGYAPAGVTFSAINMGTQNSLTVNFTGGLAPLTPNACASAWFSLEDPLLSTQLGGGSVGTTCNSVPSTFSAEPASTILLSSGLVLFAFLARRRRVPFIYALRRH